MAFRYGVLGPLVISDGKSLRTVPAAKQRALLAALLMRDGDVVPAGELCEMLWPGKPAAHAHISLHTLVNRCRRRLVTLGAGPILFRRGGYLLDTGDGGVDVRLFERAHAAGRRAARDGDWVRAAALLREALDLWRGDLLADVDVPELHATHGYANEERLDALELRIDADLRLAGTGGPVAELRRLVSAHPLRERFHAQLLVALHRSGRRADALAAFRDARAVLVGELGMEPGAELRELHGRLLADDPSPADPRAAFSPSTANLDPAAQRMFRLLSVHPGPDFSRAAAASIAGVPVARAGELLGRLARADLLASVAPERFSPRNPLGTGTRGTDDDSRTGDREELAAATRRMCDHYLHTSHAGARMLLRDRESLDLPPLAPGAVPERLGDAAMATGWFRTEHHVLVEVVRLASAAGLHTHAWQIPWNSMLYFGRFSHWGDWIATQEVALTSALDAGDLDGQAHAQRALGAVKMQCGLDAEADAHLRSALDLCARTGDRTGEAHCHVWFAYLADLRRAPRTALRHAWQALEVFRAVGHRRGEANAHDIIGRCHTDLGAYGPALDHCQRALDLFAELGEPAAASAAWAWESAGRARARLGSYVEAGECYARAAELFQAVHNRRSSALMLHQLADLRLAAGHAAAEETGGGARRIHATIARRGHAG